MQEKHLSDDELLKLIQDAEDAVAECEALNATSAAAAWYASELTLRRFLAHPHAT